MWVACLKNPARKSAIPLALRILKPGPELGLSKPRCDSTLIERIDVFETVADDEPDDHVAVVGVLQSQLLDRTEHLAAFGLDALETTHVAFIRQTRPGGSFPLLFNPLEEAFGVSHAGPVSKDRSVDVHVPVDSLDLGGIDKERSEMLAVQNHLGRRVIVLAEELREARHVEHDHADGAGGEDRERDERVPSRSESGH